MEMTMNEAGLAVLQAASTIMSGMMANPANNCVYPTQMIDQAAEAALELAQRIHAQECYRDPA